MTKKEYKEFIKYEIYKGNRNLIVNILKRNFLLSLNSVYLIRKYQYYNSNGRKLYAKFIQNRLIKKYGIFIASNSIIGKGLVIPHPNGIIIGDRVMIGDNCTIYQQVTIGSANKGDYKLGLQPKIENNCILFSGSKIIGKTNVKSNCIIGANAVVNRDTIENGVYAGVPAKMIRVNR